MSYRQRDSLASYNRITTTTITTITTTTTSTTTTTTSTIVITTTTFAIVITIDIQTWEMFIDMYDIIITNAMHKISIHVIFEY
jgi:hypothetical protein